MSQPEPPPRPPSITCPVCSRTSWHPQDVATGYCGNCHWWTSDPILGKDPEHRNGPARRRAPGHY